MKKIIVTLSAVLCMSAAYAQNVNRKIYFLADNLHAVKYNRVLEFGFDDSFEYFFQFNCGGIRNCRKNPVFSYIVKYGEKNNPESSVKPAFDYISYSMLMELFCTHQEHFGDNYDLYITEQLPGKKYRTHLVCLTSMEGYVKKF